MFRVRFAPSPTGKLHLGSTRTAVFNWLYARHTGGKFVLRIEDTDLKRSDEKYTVSILKDMKWLGMNYDELYKQSERFDIYNNYIEKLLSEGKAYYCSCGREEIAARYRLKGITEEAIKYDGFCRDKDIKPQKDCVVRLNIGEERYISFKDSVKGKITVNTKELDDFVIFKSDRTPTYNLAVVIDDALMQITHIIRGEDHITNTFKQLILYEILGFPFPVFAHLPLVMDKDKSPLSKRKGSINIEYYRSLGILPEALLNCIARLGWSHGNDEVLTVEQLIEYFDIDKLNKSNAVYDEEKMIWVNGKHIKIIDIEKLYYHFEEFLQEAGLEKKGKMLDKEWILKAVEILKGRHSLLKNLYEEIVLYSMPDYAIEEKAGEILSQLLENKDIESAYKELRNHIISISNFDKTEGLEEKIRLISQNHSVKFGELMQVLRIKLTGKMSSPDTISVIRLLGEETKKRV